jgi:hypothetical protein
MRRIDPKFESPYCEELKDILSFSRFEETEATLRRLECLRQRYVSEKDAKGVENCRCVALTGRHRAELIQKNPKVNPRNRLRKQEIAHWFEIWLETPGLFYQWLEMRKQTTEYQELLQSEAEDARKKRGTTLSFES